MEERDVAITVQNMAQFDSIKKGIDELIKRGFIVDIYIPQTDLESGIGTSFDETYDILKKLDYSIYRENQDNVSYKVLMEPYPMDIYLKFNSKYRIKYAYYLLAAKPNLTFNAENNIYYDYIMCFAKPSAQYLNVYAKTVVLDNLKYQNFKSMAKKNKKPILLYLPTYGDSSSISDEMVNSFIALKKDYYIITKKHHGTAALKNERSRIDILDKMSDEVCDHTANLKELFERANVVLSDNSGAVFEALYNKVPVALYSNDLNMNKYGDFDTYQYKYAKKGIIPYTSDVSEISEVIKKALTKEYITKQSKLSDEIYYRSPNAIDEFADFIEEIVKKDADSDYKIVHDLFVKEYREYREAWIKNDDLNIEINRIKEEKEKLQQEKEKVSEELEQKVRALDYYENGKLYQITKKLYRLNKKNR